MMDRFFPEVAAGGFSRRDGTVEFYSRVNSLLSADKVLLDFGAGRGVGHLDDMTEYRRSLRNFQGKVRFIYGVDVDPAVLQNPSLDEAYLLDEAGLIPMKADSVDVILSDWVFEHLPNPAVTISEFRRVLRAGGWICARTPNRWHYQYLASRIIPDRHHTRVLAMVQEDRKEVDIFPKHYLLNDMNAKSRFFKRHEFDDFSYYYSPEPAYLPRNAALWRLALGLEAVMPPWLRPNLFFFLRKR
ncbi:MAG: class I SAM-dependent methyltransferase [Geminicoccaceae bacterium]